MLAVALALGFRPTAGPVAWLAAVGLLTLFAFALVWLSAALGLGPHTVPRTDAIAAIAWSAGIALAGYLWAQHLYNRRRAH